jgi:hypothetical protein
VQEERARHWARLAGDGGPAGEWQGGGAAQELPAALPAGAEADAALAEVARDLPHLASGLELAGLEG